MKLITSHRGYHVNDESITENTMSAFLAAEEIGVDSFELDVQLTRDKKWIINHDFAYYNKEIAVSSSQELLELSKQNKVEFYE